MYIVIILILVCLIHQSECNLIQNSDFESSTSGTGSWNPHEGQLSLYRYDAHSGQMCLKSYGRIGNDDGPNQFVAVKQGARYQFKAYIKQMYDKVGYMMQTYQATLQYFMPNNKRGYIQRIAKQPGVRSDKGWIVLKGSFRTPKLDFSRALLSINGPAEGVDFLIDDVSLDDIPVDIHAEYKANNKINQIRKNTINFRFSLEQNLNPGDITVKIEHKRHLFGFGATIQRVTKSDPAYRYYHESIPSHFNWATVTGLGWPASATNDCSYDVYPAIKCVNGFAEDGKRHSVSMNQNYINAIKTAIDLKQAGVKVRGQSLLGATNAIPSWVHNLQGSTFKQTIQGRIKYMTNITKDVIDQWDVTDNVLDDQYLEKQSGDIHYSRRIFEMMKQAAPHTDLLMTEHDVVIGGFQTHAYAELAKDLKAYGLTGIGAQALFNADDPDPTLLKIWLDELGSAGLPIWITDLAISDHSAIGRAQKLGTALRAFFGHPAVQGVTFQRVWDRFDAPPYTSLFNGNAFTPNAAGTHYLNLVERDWSTRVTRSLDKGTSFNVDAFHGDYEMRVYNKGSLINTVNFEHSPADMVFHMHVSTGSIESPTSTAHPVNNSISEIDSTGGHPISTAVSTADNDDLQCVTRWSAMSAPVGGATVEIGCQMHEVLTGCSTFKESPATGNAIYKGQFPIVQGGNTVCQAKNGEPANTGVKAIARCCQAQGLACAYRGAGPSQKVSGAMIQAVCPQGYPAVGCMGYQENCELRGVFPRHDDGACIAVNEGSKFGAMAAAACCNTNGLVCNTVKSSPTKQTGGNEVHVECPAGFTMTGCSADSNSGKIGGAYITTVGSGDRCIAINGGSNTVQEEGLTAIGICCRVQLFSPPIVG